MKTCKHKVNIRVQYSPSEIYTHTFKRFLTQNVQTFQKKSKSEKITQFVERPLLSNMP